MGSHRASYVFDDAVRTAGGAWSCDHLYIHRGSFLQHQRADRLADQQRLAIRGPMVRLARHADRAEVFSRSASYQRERGRRVRVQRVQLSHGQRLRRSEYGPANLAGGGDVSLVRATLYEVGRSREALCNYWAGHGSRTGGPGKQHNGWLGIDRKST